MSLTLRLLALCGLVALGACETIGGAGEDIQSAGEFITEESNDAQY